MHTSAISTSFHHPDLESELKTSLAVESEIIIPELRSSSGKESKGNRSVPVKVVREGKGGREFKLRGRGRWCPR